ARRLDAGDGAGEGAPGEGSQGEVRLLAWLDLADVSFADLGLYLWRSDVHQGDEGAARRAAARGGRGAGRAARAGRTAADPLPNGAVQASDSAIRGCQQRGCLEIVLRLLQRGPRVGDLCISLVDAGLRWRR